MTVEASKIIISPLPAIALARPPSDLPQANAGRAQESRAGAFNQGRSGRSYWGEILLCRPHSGDFTGIIRAK
ncbi:hypothetical protein LCGC14_1721760 [marine sediment metagenome]|uniref:Uncharacterized protein n=1 Tax=marine sediment metagenome TaxID=412755 RepID=A0A0F9HZX1_9ZZZZ